MSVEECLRQLKEWKGGAEQRLSDLEKAVAAIPATIAAARPKGQWLSVGAIATAAITFLVGLGIYQERVKTICENQARLYTKIDLLTEAVHNLAIGQAEIQLRLRLKDTDTLSSSQNKAYRYARTPAESVRIRAAQIVGKLELEPEREN